MNLETLQAWYKTPPGSWLLQFEQDQLTRWIHQAGDARVIQLGGLPDMFSVATHKKLNYFYLASHARDLEEKNVDVISSVEELPFQRNSIDLVIISHVLEFAEHPSLVLKEAFDVLAPYGKLVLFCFNPWSYWGLHKLFADKSVYPWGGNYFSPARLARWAMMIGYSNVKDKTLCFRAPFIKRPLSRASYIIEALGQIAFPVLGAVNAFMLEKRMPGNLKNPSVVWQEKPALSSRMVEPSTRMNYVKKND